jgi:RNA polymerase sigma-70 factor (ECF subfamily)
VNDGLNQRSWVGISNGDAEVWQEFLRAEIPRLYGMFMKRWPNPSLVEELVQRTVFDAVRGRNSYDPTRGGPAKWVFGIARNNIRLEIRRRAGRPSVDGDISRYVETIDSEPLPDEVLEQKETAEVVTAALDRLEGKEQAALRAKYIDGVTAREIGRRLGITEKAAHSLLYRARISLREELTREVAVNKQRRGL